MSKIPVLKDLYYTIQGTGLYSKMLKSHVTGLQIGWNHINLKS